MVYDSNKRVRKVLNPDRGDELMGEYWYDDQAENLTSMSIRSRQINLPGMHFCSKNGIRK